MKPTDLKFPFKWEERAPCFKDGVFFVPWYYQKHDQFVNLNWNRLPLFERKAPLAIEYCAGNGTWIAEKAKEMPHYNWIAVERRFERVRKIWSKKKNFNLSNLVIICGEAEDFTSHYLKDEEVEEVYINFPDPWPKAKHAKNRLIQSPFVDELFRIVSPYGKAIFVTDDAPYSLQMIEEMQKTGKWHSAFPSPYYIEEWPGYGTSYFETLWKQKGKTIRYLQFTKKLP